ncbi:MAG TPA: MBL fold metallo-hydrolase, partial [Acholeplasmataceae bacterium]|nr:MBL fold metallo-hydrolase [Acholeplasmataceae bacterium]
MKIINLVSPILGTNCYLIIFNTKAIIIDPSVEYDLILKNLDDCKLEGIFLTHGHADHFSFLEDIYKHEKVNLYMHENAKEKLINSYKNGSELFNYPLTFNDLEKVIEVDDNQIIEIDGCLIKVITTPGHTNCSVCYLIENHLFSGDTLFYRTVGRTDLYS